MSIADGDFDGERSGESGRSIERRRRATGLSSRGGADGRRLGGAGDREQQRQGAELGAPRAERAGEVRDCGVTAAIEEAGERRASGVRSGVDAA